MSTTLPVFRVTHQDGASYTTSMAKGVTLDEARAYFVGQEFEQSDGTMKAVASVDLRPCFLFTFEGGSSRVVAGKEDETVDIARERYVGEKFAWASGRVLTVEAA